MAEEYPVVSSAAAPQARESAAKDSSSAPVIDVTKHGISKVLGKGQLPQQPLVVKAKFFSKLVGFSGWGACVERVWSRCGCGSLRSGGARRQQRPCVARRQQRAPRRDGQLSSGGRLGPETSLAAPTCAACAPRPQAEKKIKEAGGACVLTA